MDIDKLVKEQTGLSPKEINFVIEYTKDFNISRASVASNFSAQTGSKLLQSPNVNAAIDYILSNRRKTSDIDAEWLLGEAVDNHLIARQAGDIKASTSALTLIAKHTMVDALAADKVKVEPVTVVVEGELKDV